MVKKLFLKPTDLSLRIEPIVETSRMQLIISRGKRSISDDVPISRLEVLKRFDGGD